MGLNQEELQRRGAELISDLQQMQITDEADRQYLRNIIQQIQTLTPKGIRYIELDLTVQNFFSAEKL